MGDTPKNTIQPPDWLNQTFVENALKKGLKDDKLKIMEYDIKPAVGVGDNYSSCMFRAKLKIKNEKETYDKSIVIKSLPTVLKLLEYIRESRAFQKESESLTTTLPKMHQILVEAYGDLPKIYPEPYFIQDSPNDLLIMEDLGSYGFTCANRFEGLDLDHCMLVMKNLAAFHAASIALVRKEPKFKEMYDTVFWGRKNSASKSKMYTDTLEVIREKVESWSYQHYADKLKSLSNGYLEKVYDVIDRKEGDDQINVINHGDLWTNNMMFKYSDQNKPVAIKFVDFQLSYYNSPVFDILYFIFTSPKNDIKFRQLDRLLKTYHTKFIQHCQNLNLNINYSFESLKSDVKMRLLFGLAVGTTVFAIACAPPKDAMDLSNIKDDQNAFRENSNMLNNERYKRGLIDILKFLEENNVI